MPTAVRVGMFSDEIWIGFKRSDREPVPASLMTVGNRKRATCVGIEIGDFIKHLSLLIAELDRSQPRGGIGANRIEPAMNHDEVDRLLCALKESAGNQLTEFYHACNGFSLPSVSNAIFVETLGMVAAWHESSFLGRVILPNAVEFEVIPVGATGGGDFFVRDISSGRMLFLPPGLLIDGIYDAADLPVKVVADDFYGFLSRVLSDFEADLRGDEAHVYLDDW